jgi:membrane fusion protein, multidrug efflux system
MDTRALETSGHRSEEHPTEEGAAFDPGPFRPTKRKLSRSALAAGGFFAILMSLGVVPRVLHGSAMAAETRAAAEAPATVSVVRAERSLETSALVLPGSVLPLQKTDVYARANGYVHRWLFDIGARVEKGQVLAELEVSDIDEELRQAKAVANRARAGIAVAKTHLELARTNNARYGALGPSGVVSQQEVDQYQAGYDAQQSNVVAAEAAHGSALANVERLRDLEDFGVLVAPFDGVVTQRTAEVGQLVTAGTGMGHPLFKVAEVDIVRVFVNVPQLYAPDIQVGTDAPTTVRERPGRTFEGKVARTADELDLATRTLLTEVDIPNPDGALIAGMYAQITFNMTGHTPLLVVPATAVLIDAEGTRAAVVHDGAISWHKVDIEKDLGDKVAISKGLAEGDVLVAAPSDRLSVGMRVRTEDSQAAQRPLAEGESKAP